MTTEVLKLHILERPDLLDGVSRPWNTFPSGHSTVAMSLAVGAVLVAPRRLRGTVALAGVAYAAAVAGATVVTGWHRPSDTIGGGFVAVGWGAAVAAILVATRGTGRDLPGATLECAPPDHVDPHDCRRADPRRRRDDRGGVRLPRRCRRPAHRRPGSPVRVREVVIVGTDLLLVGLLLVALRGITLDPPRARRLR